MRNARPLRRLLLSAAVVLAAGVGSVGLIAPAPAAAASLPDLQVSITVTPVKATYAVGDTVTTTFVVKNAGTATAKNVRLEGGDEDGLDRTTDPTTERFDLAPGATHSLPWAGTINQYAYRQGFASGGWSFTNDAGEANPADNLAGYHIPVPGKKGTLTTKVFVDTKGDYDSTQPGLVGVTVTLTDALDHPAGSVTSDRSGLAVFTDLQAGAYFLHVVDWKIEGGDPTPVQMLGDNSAADIALVPGGGKPEGSTPPSAPASKPASVPSAPASASAAPVLPVTGGRTGLMVAVGAAVLLVGAVAIVVGRRRRYRFVASD